MAARDETLQLSAFDLLTFPGFILQTISARNGYPLKIPCFF